MDCRQARYKTEPAPAFLGNQDYGLPQGSRIDPPPAFTLVLTFISSPPLIYRLRLTVRIKNSADTGLDLGFNLHGSLLLSIGINMAADASLNFAFDLHTDSPFFGSDLYRESQNRSELAPEVLKRIWV
jgi:hypothetical protein